MKRSTWIFGGLALLFALISWPRTAARPGASSAASSPARVGAAVISPAPTSLLAVQAVERGTLAPLPPAASTVGQTTSAPPPQTAPTETTRGVDAQAALAAFDAWAEAFLAQPAVAPHQIEEGRRLAAARREAVAQEIRVNPRNALKRAVPWRWRQSLPAEITAYFEEVVTGRGRLDVYCAIPLPGADYREFSGGKMRYVTMQKSGRTYSTYVYGRRVSQMGQDDAAIQGIAVGNLLALHEDPARLLDPEEAAALVAGGRHAPGAPCSFCGIVSHDGSRVLDFGGQHLTVCGVSHAAELNATLAAAEAQARRVALASGGSSSGGNSVWTNPPPENPAGTYGTRRVLFMRVVFRDDTQVPVSESEAAQVMQEVNEFYVEASYNKANLISTITPVLTLPHPKLDYSFEGPGLVLADAVEEARKAGYSADNYDFLVVRHPNVPGFTWGGLGGGNGRGGVAWLQGTGAGLIAHELGHVFGLGHANFYDTKRPGLPNNPNNYPFDVDSLVGHDSVYGVGDDVEYGDIFDVMGSGGGEGPVNTNQQVSAFSGHFNPIGKNLLGWLTEPYIAEVTPGGTNRIYVHDTPRLVDGRHYALRVPKDAQRTYWVSARGKVNTPYATNGVELHFGRWQQALGYSQLLDTTRGTKPGRSDAAIAVGRTYADEESKVYITPIARGGVGTNAWYDLVVSQGRIAGNVAPQMELSASTNSVMPGGSVTFTITATDANADALAYYWDMSDGAVAPSSPTLTRLFTQPGEYVIRAEVSDMKGGLTSQHVVVTVGAPGTFRISGQVISTDGEPLQRVRVSNGSLTETPYDMADDYQWTYTDADGAFTLVNLTNRTYPIGAHVEGFITRPLNFDGAITIVDKDAEGVLFQATPRPIVTVRRIRDAVLSPSTPGLFELTRTGDTNTALQAVFLFGGTAAAGTDFTDWTNIVTQENVTPNPFGPVTNAYDFYAFEFPTGVVSQQLEIVPTPGATNAEDKEVTLTVMYPLQFMQITITNGSPEGTLATNTNVFDYSGWELRTINGVDTWFQTYSEYLPAWPGEATLTIKGNPPAVPTVSVIALVPVAMENLNDAAMFTVMRSGPTTMPLTVSLEVGGTATEISDYSELPATVVIPAGVSFVNLPVYVIEDFYLEGNDTVTLKVQAGPGYNASPDTAAVTIVDNDMPQVSIATTDTLASEAGPNLGTMAVTREGDLTRDLVVKYLVTGTAVSGRDYRALSGAVTIRAGQPSAGIVITPRDNGIRDGGNTVQVFLADSPTYNIGNPSLAELFIQDRALPTVSITASDASAAEPSDPGEFTLTRTGDLARELFVQLRAGGNAKPLADYVALGSRVRFPPNQSSVLLTLVPLDDRLREDEEYVVLDLAPAPEYNLTTASQARISLADDDSSAQPAVGFDFLTSSFPEGAGEAYLAVTVTANPPEGQDVTVLYKVTGGTAVPDVDYPLATSTGMVVFPHNAATAEDSRWTNRTQLIALPINDNELLESDRTMVVTLLEPPSYWTNWLTTNELTITNELGEAVTTNQVVTNYMIVGIPMNAQFDVYKSHTLTVQDDDSAIVTVEAWEPQVREDYLGGSFFRLTRQGSTNRAQKVLLQTGGSAGNGSDYQPIPSEVEIPIGEKWVDIPVLPVDDPVQEYMEDVSLTLLNVPGGTIGGESAATMTIVDNDGTVEFTQTEYTTQEGVGIARIPIRRTGYTEAAVSVDFVIMAGTALPTTDYLATNGTVTFAPGETLQHIEFVIVDDDLVETTETLALILSNLTGGAPIGGQTYSTLSILDDDASIEFASAAYRATENGTNAIISLRRVGVVDRLIRADFIATNGTATGGIEFVPTNRTISFAPGVTEVTTSVRLLDNVLIESNKTAQLLLVTNAPGSGGVGPRAAALLEIANDDCAIEFASATHTVDEFARVVTLDVRRTGGAVNRVSVDYATTNGTARAGADYFNTRGTLTFAGETNIAVQGGSGTFVLQAGETNLQFQVRIIDNYTGEGNRDFQVRLSNPKSITKALDGSAVLGGNTNAAVTIIDDELPGSVDFAFNPGLGADGPVYSVAVQPDAKILLGGEFASVDGIMIPRVARLHEDGYLDSFFTPGAGPNATVHAVAVQPDGRILLGGEFTRYDNANAPRVVRLNADGSVDPAFAAGFGADQVVRAIAVDRNGLILLGGDFLTVDGVSRPGVARLLADGSLDATFDPTGGAPGGVFALAAQPDGKVVVGGTFSGAAGTSYSYLARFNADGTIDRSFSTGAGPDAGVRSIAVAEDGKILIGGAFATFNNTDRSGVARLNADGTLDSTFDPGAGTDGPVYAVGVQADKKVLIAGGFTAVGGQAMNRYARLNPNGSVDDGYLIFQGANGLVRSLAMQPDTAMVVGGDFTALNGLPRRGVGRIHGDEEFVLSKIQFSSATYRVLEDQGPATITVIRSGDVSASAEIGFTSAGGSATAGVNYQPTNGVLRFLAGETARTFQVEVMDDHAALGNTTVNLLLTNVPPGYSLNAQLTAVLTIEDKESVLAFSAATYSVLRTDGEATVTVVRTGPTTNLVSVDYLTEDGTAVDGVDYTKVAGTLTFDPGVSLRTFLVPVLTNSAANDPRTVLLTLTNQSEGAVLGTLSNAVLSIVNEVVAFYSLNLAPPVGGSVAPGSGQYPAGSTQLLTATPDEDYRFEGWEGTTNSVENPLALLMDRNYTMAAHFAPTRTTYTFEPPFRAADLSAPPWANSAAAPWGLESATSSGGQYAIRSGPIGNSQESSLDLVAITRAGAVSFMVRVSSEANWDFLEFYLNGVRLQRWSGDLPWQLYQFNVAAGPNRLTWRYVKDANFNYGLDGGFIDDIYLPLNIPDPTPVAPVLSVSGLTEAVVTIRLDGRRGVTYVLEGSEDFTTWTPLGTNTLQGTSALFFDPLTSERSMRFYRALAP